MSSRPKLALVTRHLNVPAGMGTYIRALLERLPAATPRARITVYTDQAPDHPVKGLRYRVIPQGHRKRRARVRELLWDQFDVPAVLREDDPDLVHWLHPNAPVSRVAPKQVATVYDAIPWQLPDYAVSRTLRALLAVDRLAIRRADHVLTISKDAKRAIQKHLLVRPDRISVTYLAGMPVPNRKPPKPQSVKGPYFLFLGGSEKRKNVKRLVEAFGQAALPPTLKLVIAGRVQESPIDEDLEALLAKLSPAKRKRVIVTGKVSDAELRSLYAHARFFCFPSLLEGFGLPVLEAMACGTPVITSDASSLPEVAGDAAVVVRSDDTQALAKAMGTLGKDAARRKRLAAKGLAQAKRFDWDTTVDQTVEVYETLLRERLR